MTGEDVMAGVRGMPRLFRRLASIHRPGAKSYRLPERESAADRGVDGQDYHHHRHSPTFSLSLSLSGTLSPRPTCAIEIDFKRRVAVVAINIINLSPASLRRVFRN